MTTSDPLLRTSSKTSSGNPLPQTLCLVALFKRLLFWGGSFWFLLVLCFCFVFLLLLVLLCFVSVLFLFLMLLVVFGLVFFTRETCGGLAKITLTLTVSVFLCKRGKKRSPVAKDQNSEPRFWMTCFKIFGFEGIEHRYHVNYSTGYSAKGTTGKKNLES